MTAEQLTLCDPTWTEPDPDPDDGPWCRWTLDLRGQHATTHRLDTMTTINLTGNYL